MMENSIKSNNMYEICKWSKMSVKYDLHRGLYLLC